MLQTFVLAPPPTEIEIEIVPGERNVDSTVTITQEVPADNAKNLITYLLTVVVKANLIDRPTADRIIVTFSKQTLSCIRATRVVCALL